MDSGELIVKLYTHYEHEFLKPQIEAEYLDRINQIPSDKRRELFSGILETCKRFPTIAEIKTVANTFGLQPKPDASVPHNWIPSDCRFCRGSGMNAVFWEQLLSRGELDGAMRQELRLQTRVPYQESSKYSRDNPTLVRTIFRCECPSGNAPSLPKWPRWGPGQPAIRYR